MVSSKLKHNRRHLQFAHHSQQKHSVYTGLALGTFISMNLAAADRDATGLGYSHRDAAQPKVAGFGSTYTMCSSFLTFLVKPDIF